MKKVDCEKVVLLLLLLSMNMKKVWTRSDFLTTVKDLVPHKMTVGLLNRRYKKDKCISVLMLTLAKRSNIMEEHSIIKPLAYPEARQV
jgi:hypothetical protein